MKSIILPALAAALALATPALAQAPAGATAQTPPAATEQPARQEGSTSPLHNSNLLTINKLKQDLQKAGFSDIQIIANSFVVQAKDKDGNPTIMSLSPSGVFAISALQSNQEKQAKAGAGSSSQTETRR